MILVGTTWLLTKARGPFWLGDNFDPEYAYLCSSINLSYLQPIWHVDHPGTTMQLLGALVFRVVYGVIGPPHSGLRAEVLANPEYYLRWVQGVAAGFNILMVWFLGRLVFRKTRKLAPSLALQAAPFSSGLLLYQGFARVSPEPLLLLMTLALIAVLIVFQFSETKTTTTLAGSRVILLFALISGTALATKVTFAPLCLIPWLLLPGRRRKVAYLVGTFGFFGAFTFPIWGNYRRMLSWLFAVFAHSGIYGGGPVQIVDAASYFANLRSLLLSPSVFSVVLVVGVIVIVTSYAVPQVRSKSMAQRRFHLLQVVIAAQMASALVVAKHWTGGRWHYMLPATALSGTVLVFLWAYLRWLQIELRLEFKGQCWLAIGLALVWMSACTMDFLATYRRLRESRDSLLAVGQFIEGHFPKYDRIYSYRSSSIPFALEFGNHFSGGLQSSDLDRLYPNLYSYDIWQKSFFDHETPISFRDLLNRSHGKIVFQGWPELSVPGHPLTEVFHSQGESVYLLQAAP